MALLSRVLGCCLLFAALTSASISNNPDTWELPPGVWNEQALLGSGDLSTLVIVQDPPGSSVDVNTSLIAFSVSGGLVPLNYLQLSDGHCFSTFVADILVCDFKSSAGGITNFYQFGVNAGAGGANRLVLLDQVTAPVDGQFAGSFQPLLSPSTGRLVMAKWNYPSNHPTSNPTLEMWELDRNSTGAGLVLTKIGTVPGLTSNNYAYEPNFALNSAGNRLLFASSQGFLTYSYPALTLLTNTTTSSGQHSASVFLTGSNDVGVFAWESSNGVVYATADLSKMKLSGPATTDSQSTTMSQGLVVTSSSTTWSPVAGPCLYAQTLVANGGTGGNNQFVTQIRVPTSSTAAPAIEAQIAVPEYMGMVANDKYLFLVSITANTMYRYIAQC